MDKIKVIYNATLIANIKDGHWARSGVFFAAANILKQLAKRDDIELVLYYETDNKKLASKNIKYFCENEPQSIVHFTKIALKNKLKNIVKKMLTKHGVAIAKKLLVKKAKMPENNQNFQNNEQNTFYISAAYEINNIFMSDPNIIKFAIGYDVMPLMFPQYYPGGEGWRDVFACFDNYFAISSSAKSDFLKYLPHLKPENIIVTPLACDERFKPENSAAIAAARKKHKIPENKKYIFSLCTLEPRKNLIRAVKCFASFIRKNNIDDLVFVLGGAHWDRFISILEGEIDNLNELKDKILKIGYVNDADQAALYSGALFFVYTSQYEGFGLPPLEAMSCGAPVITSNNSSLPEVVGDAGIMIDYDDDEAHIKAYEDYYFNENLRAENSKKGLERAKKFSWEKCTDIMINEFKARMKK